MIEPTWPVRESNSPHGSELVWSDLVHLDSRLQDLEDEIRRAIAQLPDDRIPCGFQMWYGYGPRWHGKRGWGMKHQLREIVGSEAPRHAPDLLRLDVALDVADRYLIDLLQGLNLPDGSCCS
jgi:hypothetical protein